MKYSQQVAAIATEMLVVVAPETEAAAVEVMVVAKVVKKWLQR